MNKLDSKTREHVISCLIEGCSIRAAVRMTGVAKKTVMRLLCEVGMVCADYQDRVFRNLPCKRLQVDEMWSWIYCKEKNRTEEIAKKNPAAGDIWLWSAIDADTKLVPSWMLGSRDGRTAKRFIADLASRLRHRVQLTTDSHRPYLQAVEDAFGGEIDYAMLHKVYGQPQEYETRYSPAQCIGCEQKRISGNPDPEHVSTSFIERHNWTMRTNNRRMTRLSNGFSRKIENHAAAVALNYFAYNFIKIHRTLRVTPAMEAGVTDHVWTLAELIGLLEYQAKKQGKNSAASLPAGLAPVSRRTRGDNTVIN